MNRSELIEAMADAADVPKAAASRALDGFVEAVTRALKEDDQVSLVGFGTFTVRARAGRTGRNPKTGKELWIEPARVPAFKPGKALKDALN